MKNTKEIRIGNVLIGGKNKIAIQSMTNTDTKDIDATVSQIKRLEEAGCDIIRSAVYDVECAKMIPQIKSRINIPFVADIHFDYKIAVEAIKNGADKIRINPGNIGEDWKIREVVKAAKDYNIPIRVGGNTGSLSSDILKEYGISAASLVESAKRNVNVLEDMDFTDIVISLKSSNVMICKEAYEAMSEITDYPFHIGVTEAGTLEDSQIKSAIGIGSLLLNGIGDTVRVSISGDPVNEIYVAKKILKTCGCLDEGVDIISCPTCARCSLDIEKIATEIKEYTKDIKTPLKIAVMGCAVNGPGEAKDADFGVAGGGGEGLIFEKGNILKKVSQDKLAGELIKLIEKYR